MFPILFSTQVGSNNGKYAQIQFFACTKSMQEFHSCPLSFTPEIKNLMNSDTPSPRCNNRTKYLKFCLLFSLLFLTACNESPVTYDLEVITDENTATEVILTGTDDYDQESLTYSIRTLPVNGTLRVDGLMIASTPFELPSDTVEFVPTPDFNGVTGFTYRARDKGSLGHQIKKSGLDS